MPRRIMVAGRGEAAVRIARTLVEKGYHPLGIYTEKDEASPHRRYMLEEAKVSSYMDVKEIVEAALELGAEAVHPCYGFLENNPEFHREVARRGLVPIGPPPSLIEFTRDKPAVKTLAEKLDVPTLPWSIVDDDADLEEFARAHGYPLVLKPARGAWGRGIRVLWSEKDAEQLKTAVKEAEKLYGDRRIYVEPYMGSAKLLEVQVIGDGEKVIHLYEREASLQDDYLKTVIEAPSKTVSKELRDKLVGYAVAVGEALRLRNTATVEFLYDVRSRTLFLNEVNPGLSPEHVATEAVTGVDIVEKQVEAALYSALDLRQENISLNGWAFEAKVFNKKPFKGEPSSGVVKSYNEPAGLGVAVDSGVAAGLKLSEEYVLLAKVLAWGGSRATALGRLRRALSEMSIDGVQTNIPVLRELLALREIEEGVYTVRLLEEKRGELESKLREKMLLHSIVAVSLIEHGDRDARKTLMQGKLTPEAVAEESARVKRSAWFYYARLRERLRRR
ncbi:biotin carboxylase N-terminal domain-containing protein [Desulfurococcus mucosus]|uniref:Carbamoyl-phosphate synthase L chain ATP-binding protein n=1 Tax=Desulfurococcus mucosus (strain ATCC 35584 / DSM 2162 / JCM 9187 / O7/1) TaxID=765177 RepID=E8R8J1_DESM0|nr:acetyl-CoA carboxylase biotin carboxylase subunit family protein [Desulfurococcus mucosus]ADV64817.1 Carbamoyl-phosphate synthase L chain ATP-binding protein [Desulfurococcus mucosus DSM 2162]